MFYGLKNIKSIASFIIVLLASFSVHAVNINAFEDEFLEDANIPVVLTGTRLAQPQSEVPAAQTIITRDMIEASGVREIPRLLRLVPGFQVGHTRDLVSVTYHGNADAYSRRLQVLVDGRSVYTPLFGGVDWHDLPLSIDDIERIEVTRGPNGVTYGANSFIGVINIITRHPDLTEGHTVKLEAGQRNARRAYYRFSGKRDKLSYRVSLESMQDDYFRGLADDKRRNQISLRSEYRPNRVDRFSVNLGFLDGYTTKGEGMPLDDPFRDEDVRSHYQQVVWTHQRSADEEFKLNFSHNYHRVDDIWDVAFPFPGFLLLPPSPDPLVLVPYRFSLSGFEERYNLEFQHTLRVAKSLRAVWGAEARLDRVSGIHDFGYFNTSETLDNHLYRLFGNAEWKLNKKVFINAGLMVENNDVTGTNTSPRFAVNYHVARNHTLRAIASRAYRTPSTFEDRANGTVDLVGIVAPPFDLNTLFLGNPNLEPEQMTSYELGYLMSLPKIRSTVDIKLFYEKIEDMISGLEDNTFVDADMEVDPTYRTAGQSRSWGAEFQWDYRPSKKTRIWLAYALTRLKGEYLHEIQSDGTEIFRSLSPTVPRHTLSVLMSHSFPQGLTVSGGFYRATNMTWVGGDATGGYKALDFRLAKKFKTGKFKGKYEFIVHDALETYFDVDDSYISEPRVLFSMELNL